MFQQKSTYKEWWLDIQMAWIGGGCLVQAMFRQANPIQEEIRHTKK